MVTTRLYGRLGNQLFQMAATIGYSIKYNTPYCIPISTANNQVWPPYKFRGVNYCNEELKGIRCFYKEPEHSYNEIPNLNCDNAVVEGYFQSEKYFSHCREEIVETFGFDDIVTNLECCSIHVRLGDYKLYPTRHPIVTPEYLRSAIELMKDKGYSVFKIFSDEPDEAAQMILDLKVEGVGYVIIRGRTEIEDMRDMASCGSNIIANSSFSWWGAWLNPNPNKVIISPKVWFGPENSHLDTSTLIPESWVKM